ncbi:MAG TPA: branched-chain amino acid ABC transporter permease [Devosia sp.]|nr:branched-chain amino acid ABC transporter permease [Devosia sp.]
MSSTYRGLWLYFALIVFIVAIALWQGSANVSLLLLQGAAFALVALGLNIQFGYGGLFNFGIMGMMMIGGFAVTFISYPINMKFWGGDGPLLLLRAFIAFAVGFALVWAARRAPLKGGWKAALVVACWFVAYVLYRSQIDPAAEYIEKNAGFVGGLGLHPVLGWIFGGVLAAGVAWIIGKISLGLRTDYLAIATIGIGEIIRALIKNADWLTRGTLTVSPIPWPVPTPDEFQATGTAIDVSFVYARLGYFALAALVLALVMFLIQRAYGGPWGRMMRAIRDNYIAANSMGKNVTSRQLEVFVIGSILMGIGGAMLVSILQIFDPGSYQPINHTFLFWVMVIVGGAGNNFGALLGAMFIYLVWVLSAPLSQALFYAVSGWTTQLGWGAIPDIDSRSLQMRVFVLGIVIVLALRYAPRGLIPEVVRRER